MLFWISFGQVLQSRVLRVLLVSSVYSRVAGVRCLGGRGRGAAGAREGGREGLALKTANGRALPIFCGAVPESLAEGRQNDSTFFCLL